MAIEALDPASQMLAPVFKTTAQEWTDAFAPELIVWAEEIPAGLLLPGLGRVVAGAIAGLSSLAYLALANPTGRDKEAVQHMAAHWLTHPGAAGLFGLAGAGDVTPLAFAQQLQSLKTGIAAGNLDLVRAAFMFSPADIASYFNSVGSQFQALFAAGPAAAPGPAVGPGATTGEAVTEAVQALVGYGEVF